MAFRCAGNSFGAPLMRERRSLVNFALLIVVAVGTTIFLLQKAREAIAEIERLQDTSAFVARQAELGP